MRAFVVCTWKLVAIRASYRESQTVCVCSGATAPLHPTRDLASP